MSGALLPEAAYKENLKHALATMIMHLGPTESHKQDAFFIHSLRKAAANQVAHAIIMEAQAEKQKKLAEEHKALEAKKALDETKHGWV